MKTRQEVRVYQINKQCDHCKKGNLINADNNYGSTQYRHCCTNLECDNFTWLDESYPKLIYEPIGKMEIIEK
jgi:hypothetical protein